MSFENSAGLNVHNHYGQRNTGGGAGNIKSEGAYKELTVDITGESLNSTFLPTVTLPAGSLPVSAFVDVSEVFVLGGTTPTIEVGTSGSEATNGVTVTEAQAEAVGTVDITAAFAGTWAASLAAETTVGVAMGGTSPTATATAGKAKVIVRYIDVV